MGAARDVPGWEPPASFDSFAVERPLGAGGMGHVYLGRDTMLDRLVALKFIAQESPSEEMKQRFIIEARAIAKLAHPNVVSVFRIGEVEGKPYIAYEFVTGRSFVHLARPMPWATALRIALLLSRGLDAAHKAGIVHRDVKPANVMLSDSGEVKLLDFGIAKLDGATDPRPPVPADPGDPKERRPPSFGGATTVRAALTRPGALVGTPAYLAPEIWSGESATVRSDVFAVGLILWELLTGALPFAPLLGEALARAVVEQDIAPIRTRRPDIPQSFADIVDRCVRRHPLVRWESGTDLCAALEEVSAVFLPRSGNVDHVHLDDEAHAVAASFTRILPRAMEFTSSVYEKLFASDPSLKALFPPELEEQKTKLAHALRVAVEGLREPERLVPFLQDLGRRHVAYGVQPAHFDTLGAALHATLREFDSAHWSGELSSAWRSAYGFLATAMRQGLGAYAQTSLTGDPDAPLWSSNPSPSPDPPSPTPQSVPTPPRTRYAQSGAVSLAYHVTGEGPVDLVLMMGWLSHLELSYAHPTFANFLRRLSRRHRVIVFDKRGTGLSDRVGDPTTFSQHLEDIRVIMDAADSERAVFFGIGEAAAMATLFAGVHPERTLGVVAWGGSARPVRDASKVDAVSDVIRKKWGEPLFVDVLAPSQAADPTFSDWVGTYLRTAGSPSSAIALLKANSSLDIHRITPAVGAPAVVIHRKGDRLVPVERGRELASLMLRARFVELEGEDHLPFVGDVPRGIAAIEAFTAEVAKDEASGERFVGHPISAIVALASGASSAAGAAVATGRLVGREGDDVVYAFDSIDEAVAFARIELREKRAARAAVHVGPCAARSPSLATPSVIETRQLAASAADGALAVSDTVKDLAFGVDLSS